MRVLKNRNEIALFQECFAASAWNLQPNTVDLIAIAG
jgi:hypothetical protein